VCVTCFFAHAGRVGAPGAEPPHGAGERQPEQQHHDGRQQQQLRQQPAGRADAGSQACAAGARTAQDHRPVGEQA